MPTARAHEIPSFSHPAPVGSETAPPGAPASACAVREDKHWIGIQAGRGDRQNDDLFRDQLVRDEEAFPTGVIAGKSPKPAAVATHSNICRAMCVTPPVNADRRRADDEDSPRTGVGEFSL